MLIICPKCESSYKVTDDINGKKLRCFSCKNVWQIVNESTDTIDLVSTSAEPQASTADVAGGVVAPAVTGVDVVVEAVAEVAVVSGAGAAVGVQGNANLRDTAVAQKSPDVAVSDFDISSIINIINKPNVAQKTEFGVKTDVAGGAGSQHDLHDLNGVAAQKDQGQDQNHDMNNGVAAETTKGWSVKKFALSLFAFVNLVILSLVVLCDLRTNIVSIYPGSADIFNYLKIYDTSKIELENADVRVIGVKNKVLEYRADVINKSDEKFDVVYLHIRFYDSVADKHYSLVSELKNIQPNMKLFSENRFIGYNADNALEKTEIKEFRAEVINCFDYMKVKLFEMKFDKLLSYLKRSIYAN